MAEAKVSFLGTGAGNSINRNHTAIVLDFDNGTRVLLDASSGNSVLRQGEALGIKAQDFDQVLLSHRHGDHMGGLPFLQTQRTFIDSQGPPLHIYSTEPSLEALRALCGAILLRGLTVDREGGRSHDGNQVLKWHPTPSGHSVELGTTAHANCFPVDHIEGAVGWRIESNGIAVVFSGDTRFSESLVEASKGADLLIHEALSTQEHEAETKRRGHSTAGDAGRAAAMANVGELILTHIDTPYHEITQSLVDEARQFFDGPVSVARDLLQVTVSA